MALPRRRSPQRGEDREVGTPGAESDWRALYKIENPTEVDAYVAEHPNVVPVLERAPDEIARQFGADAGLILRCVVDPDDEPPSDYLSLGIQTKLDDDEAYVRRDQLDDAWWNDALRDVPGDLTIDIERR